MELLCVQTAKGHQVHYQDYCSITNLPQQASVRKASKKKIKASRKASPTAEMLKDNARAISDKEIKTCHADLACLELLLNGQLTASVG